MFSIKKKKEVSVKKREREREREREERKNIFQEKGRGFRSPRKEKEKKKTFLKKRIEQPVCKRKRKKIIKWLHFFTM
jgi:hypothetical protein